MPQTQTCFSCKFFLLVLICSGAAFGQQDPASPQTKPVTNPPTPATTTRARQVSTVPKKTNTDQAASPEKTPQPAPAAEDDSFAVLREQINNSASPDEQARLRLQLAEQLSDAGRRSEALKELHSLAGEERFDPTGLFNVGNRLVRLGDQAGAIEAYRKAIDQRKGHYSRALNNLGFVLLQTGQWDQAYEALMSALRLEGFRYAEASYNLGRLYAARGQTDLAVREWRRTLAIDPQHAGASLALRDSKSDGNITVGEKTANGNGANEDKPRTTIGTLKVDQATFDLLQRARNDRDRGRNEEAVREYQQLLTRKGGYFGPATLELAYALITLKRFDEAMVALLAVSSKDGARYPIAYFHLARLYEFQGQLKPAAENYSRAAVAYAGGNLQFLVDLARVREKLGDFAGALSALEQYAKASARGGQKPDWVDERLEQLRAKVAALADPTRQ
jgi:tetratricopeptide (TPR) repeat protein